MKIAILASLVASAVAFAPSPAQQRSTSLKATTAELESMIGVTSETGGKIVSSYLLFLDHG